MPHQISDTPVYQESYYQGGSEEYTDETYLLCVDGPGCSTPEFVFVPAESCEEPSDWIDYGESSGEVYCDIELYGYHPLD